MRRLFQIIAVASLISCWPTASRAQSGAVDSTEVMRQLLSMPAPTPRSAETPTDDQPKKRSPKFFDKDNAPPDSAPLEDLLEYWDRWANSSDRPDPSDSVRKRLLDACADDLQRLAKFLPLFSSSESTAAKVKELSTRGRGIRNSTIVGVKR